MVRMFLSALGSKISGLREAALWLSLFSFFSQILALLRDRLLTHNFGAGMELDIYYAAFKLPDLIFVTVASIVSVSALVPLFAKKESEGEKHLKDATDSIFTTFSFSIVLACAFAFLLIPSIIRNFFGDLGPTSIKDIILFSRILLLSPLLLGFSNFFGSIIQYEKRFILYSISPLLYNLGIILGIYFLSDKIGIFSAVWGVIFGATLHLSLQAVYVLHSPFKPKITFNIKWVDVFDTARISVPRTLALSIVSFVGFFFAIIASGMGVGSIAVFNLSWNLQSAPISLIGVSFSLAAFPALAVSFAKNNMKEVVERISDGLRQIIFWSLPFTAFLVVLRAHIVRVILGSGVFDWQATRLVAGAFAVFVLSLVFQNILIFLSRSHYALGKTRWPLLANVLSGVLSVVLALLFLNYKNIFEPFLRNVAEILKIEDLSYTIISLPLAFSLGALFGSVLLFFALGSLRKEIWQNIKKPIFKIFVSSFVLGYGSYLVLKFLDSVFYLDTFFGVLGHGFFAGLAGIVMWGTSLYIMKEVYFREMLIYVKSKMKA